jgi:hypothetical protein
MKNAKYSLLGMMMPEAAKEGECSRRYRIAVCCLTDPRSVSSLAARSANLQQRVECCVITNDRLFDAILIINSLINLFTIHEIICVSCEGHVLSGESDF